MHRMKTLRTGVIGVGRLGRAHARWLKSIETSELIGVFDISAERASAVADECGVTAFANLDALLADVDVVSVVTPTAAHHEIAMRTLQAGKHALVEKPIASTLNEADEIIALARAKGLRLAVGHIERFNPAVLAIQEESLTPRFIEAHRLAAFDPRGTDVAVMLDLMVHDIDLALTLTKSTVQSIEASAVAVISDHADIANSRLTFANGAVANLTASRISLKPMRKIRLFQRSGYYSLDLESKRADVYTLAEHSDTNTSGGMRVPLGKSGRDILYESRGGAGEDMLKMELEAFLAAVRGERPVAVTGEAGRAALAVALDVERIARESSPPDTI